MADLRKSGSLEQDADVVILLHREDAYDKDSPRSGEADLIVVTQCGNGPPGPWHAEAARHMREGASNLGRRGPGLLGMVRYHT